MKRLTSLLAAFLVLACLLCACDAPQSDHILNTDTQGTQAPGIGSTSTESQAQPQPDTEAGSEVESTTAAEAEDKTDTDTETEAETQPGCAHADADDNGICDVCTISVIVSVDLFSINDLHGKFNDTDDQPGVDELTTYLKGAVQSNPYTVLLSSGDMWQGSSESNLTKGLLITDWMNELGFASMTLGNHEFDWGIDPVVQNQAFAQFPILAINVYDRSTGKRVDYCAPSVLIDKGDVQIGIIGAIGDCYSSISADKVQDIYFVTDDALTELVKAEADALRAQGADLIVYSIHDSGEEYDSVLSSGYVDVVFEGHSHKSYVKQDAQGIYHLQGGGDNDGITHATAKVNYVTGSVSVVTAEYLPSSKYTSLADDPLIEQLNQKYADQLAIGNVLLGRNAKKRYSNVIKQKVADLYLEYGLARWGKQYNIVLGGGYLNTRSPYDLAAGEVHYSDLQMLLPFDNQIVLCSIKGSDLLNRFINTSNSSYYITLSDYGTGIKNSIDRNATYYIITDSYCAAYAANRLTVVDTYDQTTFARDLIAEYIRQGNWSK